jgi:lipooligosaccharide transport system ATP-binding protein
MDNIIIADGLVKHYGEFRALKGISFSVRSGECFGFLGHNGAGKSTTMKMIYGLSTVEEGALTLFGQSYRLTPPSIKAQMGVVPQEDNLDTELSVIENLETYGGLFGLSRREAQTRTYELLDFMGLSSKAKDHVENLSGGLKRRLVIARALINRPKLVVLDEPTTGLDPQARHLVWQKLRSLKSEGVTLLLTTHYMEEASQLCDRLVLMHEGLILAEGSPSELVKSHVLPYAIEVRLPMEFIPDDFENKVISAGGEILRVADGLFLYAIDGEGLWNRMDGWGVPRHTCFLRASILEDVFLKLTGGRPEL